jgi:hypothetical protein
MLGKNASPWTTRPCRWRFFEIRRRVIPPELCQFRGDTVYLRSGSRQTIANSTAVPLTAGSVPQKRFPANHSPSWLLSRAWRSVPQKRFPANHSNGGSFLQRLGSVPQKRFPANHSMVLSAAAIAFSVPQKRFPANHSKTFAGGYSVTSVPQKRFPANHSRGRLALPLGGAPVAAQDAGAIEGAAGRGLGLRHRKFKISNGRLKRASAGGRAWTAGLRGRWCGGGQAS